MAAPSSAPARPSLVAAGPSRIDCPRCGRPVLRTPAGELLETEPHPLAIDLPDGGKVTIHQAAAAAVGDIPPIGHHVHIVRRGYGCHPKRRPGAGTRRRGALSQLALFPAA